MSIFNPQNLPKLAPNVLVVYDVFAVAIKGKPQVFHATAKMWRTKTPQRALARLVFCVA
jgi:hypothetical protein